MRKKNKLVYSLFGLAALVCLLVSALLPDGLASTLAKDAGVVLGAVLLVDVIWSIIGGDPLSSQIGELRSAHQILLDSSDAGLSRVLSNADDYVGNWTDHAARAVESIDLAGHTLDQLIDNQAFRSTLRERAERGVLVRILINSPGNPATSHGIDPANDNLAAMEAKMRASYEALCALRDSLPDDKRANLAIHRLAHGHSLRIALRRFDREMFVVPYLFSRTTPTCPLYVLDQAGALFTIYNEEFDRLVELSP